MKPLRQTNWFTILSLVALVQTFGLLRAPAPPITHPIDSTQIAAGGGITNGQLAAASAVNYWTVLGVADDAARRDIQRCFVDLAASSVSANFVDGLVTEQRFGTNQYSLMCRAYTGQLGAFTADGFGTYLTNALQINLPDGLTNFTIVLTLKLPPSSGGGTAVSLCNTTTLSSVEFGMGGGGLNQIYENYRLHFYENRANPAYSNLFMPLWVSGYDYTLAVAQISEPRVFALVRDSTATWKVYQDSVQGKIALSTPLFTFQCPTNATDVLSNLFIGSSGVTNGNGSVQGDLTNFVFESVLVFNTTNAAAVVTGYKMATDLAATEQIDSWFGDSLLASAGASNYPSWFYSRTHPKNWNKNFAQGGSTCASFNSVFLAGGGAGVVTNLPAKFQNPKALIGFGINDGYANGTSGSSLAALLNTAFTPFYNANAKVIFFDIPQVATNASAYTYSLATETNMWAANMIEKTNPATLINEYIPRRDSIGQSIVQTNGAFSTDGVHYTGRGNYLVNIMMADFVDNPPAPSLTNLVTIP